MTKNLICLCALLLSQSATAYELDPFVKTLELPDDARNVEITHIQIIEVATEMTEPDVPCGGDTYLPDECQSKPTNYVSAFATNFSFETRDTETGYGVEKVQRVVYFRTSELDEERVRSLPKIGWFGKNVSEHQAGAQKLVNLNVRIVPTEVQVIDYEKSKLCSGEDYIPNCKEEIVYKNVTVDKLILTASAK